jgi:hypothetical protein
VNRLVSVGLFGLKGLALGMVLLAVLVSSPAYAADTFPRTNSVPLASAPLVGPGQSWFANGCGVDGDVYAVATSGNDVYIGGNLFGLCGNTACDVGNSPINYIAKWNGSSWSSVGFGLNGTVHAIAISGNNVYVGGVFDASCGNLGCSSGNVLVNHIAKWDGNSWSAVGNGFDSGVLALAVDGGEVYAGGAFEQICGNAACDSGGSIANHVAHWNGSAWNALAYGVDNLVHAIALQGDDVFVGGGFQMLCNPINCDSSGTKANGIASWDGSAWYTLDFGLNGAVWELVTDSTNVYLGGGFQQLCGDANCVTNNVTVNNVAKWDGSNFAPLGNGVDQGVSGLALDGTDLYVSGGFRYACGPNASSCLNQALTVNRIAKWNDAGWARLEYGFSGPVVRVAKSANGITAVGTFVSACGNRSCNFSNRSMNKVAEYRTCTTLSGNPQLRKPKTNSRLSKPNVLFQWGSAVCADTYFLTVKNTTLHTTPVKASDIADVQYKANALPNGNYKWFVRACNSAGCVKSATWKFTLQ